MCVSRFAPQFGIAPNRWCVESNPIFVLIYVLWAAIHTLKFENDIYDLELIANKVTNA